MKTILTIFLFAATFFTIDAQSVIEKEASMSLGKHMAFSIDIDDANMKETEKVWKKFAKEYGKTKRNKKAKEYYSTQVSVPIIARDSKIDMYVKFDEKIGYTTTYLWIDLAEGFVDSDSHPREALGAEAFLKEFFVAVRTKVIGEKKKEQEKMLNKLDKELRKLEKKNKGYHKDIEDAKEEIDDAEKNIEKNLTSQEDQRIKIEQQKRLIQSIIDQLNKLGNN
ncbi:MAG: hypothetical protein V3V14_01550 [Saprospiraceae bacterium]